MDTNAMDDEHVADGATAALEATMIAHDCADAIFAVVSGGGPAGWAEGGSGVVNFVAAGQLASFVRSAPGCSGETLFRWAAGQGLHALDVEAWRTPALEATRAAYNLFAYVLPFADAMIAERRDARAEAQRPAPILMAESDTVLARFDGPLQRIDAAPAQVAIGAPAKAEPDAPKPAKSARKGKSAA